MLLFNMNYSEIFIPLLFCFLNSLYNILIFNIFKTIFQQYYVQTNIRLLNQTVSIKFN